MADSNVRLINATPHQIVILGRDKTPIRTIDPSGMIFRLMQTTSITEVIQDIPVVEVVYSKCDVLPPQVDGVYYIVSSMLRGAFPDRKDFLVPMDFVRNNKGEILGCMSLSR